MNPRITNISESNNILNFTLSNVDVSIANAIRRTLLSNIPCIVFKTIPYNDSKININVNTTNFNNEFIKQRLSCIPIHIDDMDFPIDDYRLEIDVQNETDEVIYVTTEDFKIKNIKLNNYLANETVKKIFPPDNLTGRFIDFVRLNPKVNTTIPGGHLKLECDFSIGTASEEGMFNVVNSKNGTAYNAEIARFNICGKTGTAQNPHGDDHSIYIAFAPKNNPEIAIAVFIENAGWGSKWAAPIGNNLIQKYFELKDK